MQKSSCTIITNPYNGKILSISRDNNKYGLIGGKQEYLETSTQCAIRETLEEAFNDNDFIKTILQLSLKFITNFNIDNNNISFFLWSVNVDEFDMITDYLKVEKDKHLKWLNWNELCKSSISPFYIENQFIYNYLQENF
jgi:8-oxo-dGTP pyrophosphatase MutT (NUDIX family)